MQRGVASPRFVPGILSGSEDAVYHFVTMVASGYMGRELARASVEGGLAPSKRSVNPAGS